MSQHPTGRYTALITKAEVGESTKKGTPGVFFSFQTSEGEIDGTLWLSEKPYERSLNTLRECFGFNDDFASLAAQAEGREVSITVETETDDKGKDWSRVKWINAIRAAAKPVAGGMLARLSAQAKAIAKPAGMPAPQPAKPKPAPASAAINDGDVPF